MQSMKKASQVAIRASKTKTRKQETEDNVRRQTSAGKRKYGAARATRPAEDSRETNEVPNAAAAEEPRDNNNENAAPALPTSSTQRKRKSAVVREDQKRKQAAKKNLRKQSKAKYEKIDHCVYSVGIKKKNHTPEDLCNCLAQNKKCSDFSCINRASNIECPASCPVDDCRNQRFAKREYAEVEEFHTDSRGVGVRATKQIKKGTFIMEYVGHVLDIVRYASRKARYLKVAYHHHYFFHNDSHIVDATDIGNPSRNINHSCEPNARAEKWLVPGTPQNIPHIGLFANRTIEEGEEISFDYQFKVYGMSVQPCLCGAASCKGWIGEKITRRNP